MKLKPLLLVLACTAIPMSQALAQTAPKPQPARPAAKPAAKPATPAAPAAPQERTATLGGSGGGSSKPILTREELRACLKQEETIRVSLAEHQAARAPLDKEREDIAKMREALAAERAQVQAASDKAAEFRARMEAHAARVAQWNRDVEAFNSNPPKGPFGERERVRINTEREALQKAQTEFEAERATVAAQGEKAVAAYNANAKALEARVADWNQRNQAWNEAGQRLESQRNGWVDACADRRYREDDEIAIKAGR